MKLLVGIDFGGGSAKATALDLSGRIVCEGSVEYPTYHPFVGACEQDAKDWTDALCRILRELTEKIPAEDILGLAIDSATHTFLAADKDLKPLRRAVHWTDSRSREESAFLRETAGELVYGKTYHKPDTIWTLPQLLWIRKHEPEVFSATRYLFFEKDYLRRFLTGVWCTDHIEAQGSMLYDTAQKAWSPELCALIGLDPCVLPPLREPTDVIGSVTEEAARQTGLVPGTPVICGTTDTVMEIFAAGAVSKGDTTVKIATAGRICAITDRPYPDRDVVNYSHVVPGLWYPGSATKAAASSHRWYRDTFGGTYDELNVPAAKIPAGSEGLVFHPYINGELTPYADPTLCGSFVGIRSTHTRAHFTRALMEGVAYSLMASKKKLLELNVPMGQSGVLIGGGAKSALWQQIVADALNMSLTLTRSSDSSLGSAMLVGVAMGVFASPLEAAEKCVITEKTVTPTENAALYRELFKEYEAIHDALAPVYHRRES